jgi:hypothetical protein
MNRVLKKMTKSSYIILYILYVLNLLYYYYYYYYMSQRYRAPTACGRRIWPYIWSAAAIISRNQSRTTYKGWFSSLGIGKGTNVSPPRIQLFTESCDSVTRKDLYNASVINKLQGDTPTVLQFRCRQCLFDYCHIKVVSLLR